MMASRTSPPAGASLALLALCLSAVALAAGAPAGADSHVAIEEDAVEQARGDVATFTLSVPQGESVAFVLDGSGPHRHRLNLTDAEPDGRITLSLNTYLAGPNATARDIYGVAGQDTLSAVENGPDGQLDPAAYRAKVYANGTDGDPADTAELTLAEPGPANASVLVAPHDAADRLDSVAAVERGREEGWVTRADRIAETDTLVLRLTVPGIAGAVANETGGDPETRFRRFLDRPNVSLEAIQTTSGPERPPKHFWFDGANVSSVAADPANDTYYVAARLVDVPYSYADADQWTDEGDLRTDQPNLYDDVLVPRLTVDGTARLDPGNIYEENFTAAFEVTWPEASLSQSQDYLLRPGYAAGPNQTVTGYTNVAPGTRVTVSVTDADGIETPRNATGVVTRERVAMAADHEPPRYVVRATLNLSGVEPDSEINLTLAPTDREHADEYRFDSHRAPVGVTASGTDPATATPSPTPAVTPSPTPTAAPTPTATPSPTETSQTPEMTTDSPVPSATTTGDGSGFGALPTVAGLSLAGLLLITRRRGWS